MNRAMVTIDMDFFPLFNILSSKVDMNLPIFAGDNDIPRCSPKKYWHEMISTHGIFDGFPGPVYLVKRLIERINEIENISLRVLTENHLDAYNVLKDHGEVDLLLNIDNHHDLGYSIDSIKPEQYNVVRENNWCISAIKHGLAKKYCWVRSNTSDTQALEHLDFVIDEINIGDYEHGSQIVDIVYEYIKTISEKYTETYLVLTMSPYYTLYPYWDIVKEYKYDKYITHERYDKYTNEGNTYKERWGL